jgi:uncharacterized membrane protein (UPF0127 family)
MARSPQPQPSAAPQSLAIVVLIAILAGIGGMLAVALGTTTADAAGTCPADAECITIHTDSGDHLFTVEWAVDRQEQACGLMFRPEMAADHGMVFDFGTERPVSFWMHNTLIPLDMIFIRASGEVLNIAENTTPLSDESVPSAGPVRYVLEVNGGVSASIGLAPGDLIDLERAPGMTAGTAICYPGPA